MEKLKSLGGQQGPSAAFHTLIEGKGNLTEVRGLGELPKSTKQVSYLARRPSSVQQQGSSAHGKDAWYELLVECKTQSRFQDTAFLRGVKCAPEHACFLGNNRQINDISRFCTDPTEFQPIYVDATFNLGQFSLSSFGLSSTVSAGYCTFGRASDGEYVPGLVDCRAIEEFQCRLDALEEKWSQADEPGKEAYRWFVKTKHRKFFVSLVLVLESKPA